MSASRLPGIYFETVTPTPPPVLPRMDIAAFVGFAPSGPLDVPVAIEDAGRYQEIFGIDQALAWDTVEGGMANAQTPAAVRAFFRNGGTRCWMVRVADNSQAVSNQFLLSGMLQVVPGSPCQPGWLEARSEGSWSDDLNVNATLSFGPIEADPPKEASGATSILLYPNSNVSAAVGDLLQISFDQAPASPPTPSPVLFLPADSVSYATVTNTSGAVQQVVLVSSTNGVWFLPASPQDFAALETGSPPVTGVERMSAPLDVSWMLPPAAASLSVAAWGIEAGSDPLQLVFDLPRSQAEEITPGSWLRIQLAPGNLPAGATELLALVAGVRGSPNVQGSSSPSADEVLQVFTSGAWWALKPGAAWNLDLSSPRASVVTLEVWVRDGSGLVTTLSNLGLTPLHPSYVGYLPTDAQLFTRTSDPTPPPGALLWEAADSPRFALASGGDMPLYIPLGVPGILDGDFYQPALEQPGTPLERDGLALAGGQLTAAMFVDPDLAGSDVYTLLTDAFHKLYQLQRGDGPPGEPLQKMHAILPIGEISLLALPDAAQPGWAPSVSVGSMVGAPELVQASLSDSEITLAFKGVPGATSYMLEQSSDPLFSTASVAWQGIGQVDSTNSSLLDSGPVPQATGCPSTSYFRVAAVQGPVSGPWSNTLGVTSPHEIFRQCETATLAAPVMGIPTASRGRVALAWSAPAGSIDSYQLQVSYDAGFTLPELLYDGPNNYFEVWSDPSRTAYFRVSAVSATLVSPWSNTAVVASDQAYARYVMNTVSPASGTQSIANTELLAIHQAMVRLCSARADVFTFLSLPQAYDAATSVLYRQQLVELLAPEGGDTTLSFGAIYFPWLTVRDASDDQPGAIRTISPEGTVIGSTAAMTLASGAWYSPANQILTGVVDLMPHLQDNALFIFFGNQINLVAQESRGFVTESSFTLSSDSLLGQMNVRRLLILLRRLALQEGVNYVFQGNDNTLWRVVRRRFEEILNNLFLQGAFAGSTPDQSFRVRTDSSINPPESVAQGNFIVEIRVAPSVPMEFLTVQLEQTGGDLTFSEV